ncbi:putative serine protease YyxA [Collibacillus ludicampi]|jgi:serine protease Do|uniref:Serine protease YyxA n=1 Tax=Collibacillus ludicampi TaxID=2771369 RepID=A0AAV4LDC1_9BACL|nr:trypsin-like peptidase domain-containing protein [Collibacillus ludicampi]GIM45847.1 putative serine protease YyxA [Collibacillus ludicampi]
MGFYDDFDTRPKRQSPLKWFALIVVSALVGSGTTLALVPTMIKSNWINIPSATAPALDKPVGTTGVTVNVNSQVTQAVNKVKPAIVGVLNLQKTNNFWSDQSQTQETGSGSGILFDKEGHIVTNNHVVEGASEVDVVIGDQQVKAKVLGQDKYTDLAVLQVPADKVKDIQPAQFGNSDALQIGEPAIAIGNPLGQAFAQSVTVGVISATKRDLPVKDPETGQELMTQTVLQTDAAINPGNSGGALVNIAGQVVGINSAKIAMTGVEGIGFAIPINEAKPIIQQLMNNGKVVRPMLGVAGYNLSDVPEEYRPDVPVDEGVLIKTLSPEAKSAGLQRGDVIVKIDNQDVKNMSDLKKYLFTKQPGDTVQVTVYRGHNQKTVSVKLQTLQN